MADIIGSYERLPNDAVRAVAVAKRREYMYKIALYFICNSFGRKLWIDVV